MFKVFKNIFTDYPRIVGSCILLILLGKGEAIPLQAWTNPQGSRSLRLPDFNTISKLKVVKLSALHTDYQFPPHEIFLVLISLRG
jgi:hypothetical protein